MANLRFTNHKDPDTVTQEFQNLNQSKQSAIEFGTDAPTSATKGKFYVQYTADDSDIISLHIRHPNTGEWRKVDLT